MDPRLGTVKMWPMSWDAWPRGFISWQGLAKWMPLKSYVRLSSGLGYGCNVSKAHYSGTEPSFQVLGRCFCCRHYRPGRVPSKCKEVLEKSPKEAFASWMSRSRVFYHFWSWEQLLSEVCPSQPEADLAPLLIFERFNWAARKLHKRLEQLGAKELYPRGEADEQHEEGSVGERNNQIPVFFLSRVTEPLSDFSKY